MVTPREHHCTANHCAHPFRGCWFKSSWRHIRYFNRSIFRAAFVLQGGFCYGVRQRLARRVFRSRRSEKRRESYEKPFSVDEFKYSGTEKQIKYAQDVIRQPLDYADANINRYETLASQSKREQTKKSYLEMADEFRAFKRDTTQQLRGMAKTGQTVQASNVIDHKRSWDGDYMFNQWKRNKKR